MEGEAAFYGLRIDRFNRLDRPLLAAHHLLRASVANTSAAMARFINR
jgi:hypothetical protein